MLLSRLFPARICSARVSALGSWGPTGGAPIAHFKTGARMGTAAPSDPAPGPPAPEADPSKPVAPPEPTGKEEKREIMFGKWPIDPREVFHETEWSLAIVNFKPVVPGHVLVLPRRVVPRFADLTTDETCDLWLTAQRIGGIIEGHFEASSLTFTIQDGTEAGQTVAHVHIHIMPRKAGDFEKNDDIYTEVEKNEKELDRENEKETENAKEAEKEADKEKARMDEPEERKPRTIEDMAEEADQLRILVQLDCKKKD